MGGKDTFPQGTQKGYRDINLNATLNPGNLCINRVSQQNAHLLELMLQTVKESSCITPGE